MANNRVCDGDVMIQEFSVLCSKCLAGLGCLMDNVTTRQQKGPAQGVGNGMHSNFGGE